VEGKATGQARNYAIQRLRAVAALAVVVDHSIQILASSPGSLIETSAVRLGGVGVWVFFVISGYVMMAISFDRFGATGAVASFVRSRVVRIVPLYWLVTVVICAVPLTSPSASITLHHIGASLLFVPTAAHPSVPGFYPILSVGWSLNYEMAFYAIFALALLARRVLGIALLVLVLGAATALSFVMPWLEPFLSSGSRFGFYLSTMCGFFLAGVVLALVERRYGIRRITIMPTSTGCVIIGGLVILNLHAGGPLAFALNIAGCTACVAICLMDPRRSKVPSAELLGDASYTTYLIHAPLLWTIAAVLPDQRTAPALIVAAGGGIVAVMLSVLCHRWIERPLLRSMAR
jgi:exopolysaccharide production protein ExoZ